MDGGPKESALVWGQRFVCRTPLLPLATFAGWRGDIAALRARLREVIARPEVNEAIFVASPDLHESLPVWLEGPDTPRGQRVERALVRYVSRMAARPTPFGLFAAVSVGELGDETRMDVGGAENLRRHTRLDNDYLFALCAALASDPQVRANLHYWPSSSLYEAAGRLRYAEARVNGRARSYHLVAVEPSDYLHGTLERARHGARAAELAAALVGDDPEVDMEEAGAFIDELIDAQILVSRLVPPVTGAEPIHGIIEVLSGVDAELPAAGVLDAARAEIAAMDRDGVGQRTVRYREIADRVRALPADVELARLFQVDLIREVPGAALHRGVAREVAHGVEILRRMSRRTSEGALVRFRQDFTERYESREVPLLEALDEEAGIGFGVSSAPSADAAPLLAGLRFGGAPGASPVAPSGRDEHLLALLEDTLRRDAPVLELTDRDVDRLSGPEPPPLPDALSATVTVVARSAEAVDGGAFRVVLERAGGPSGARLLGRFCHASPDIDAAVREHLQAEESLHADALFAEIVHLPEGRLGNILSRPVLRQYELPYLGVSGAPADRQISVDDLWISVVGERIVLRSRRRGTEVVPRLTNAHNVSARSLGVYRFLCALQGQDGGGVAWSWGILADAPFLPRVCYGRLVLARARWRLGRDQLDPLASAARGAGRARTPVQIAAWRERQIAAARALRERLRLPRFIAVADGDNELPVDFDNDLSLASFVQLVKTRSQVDLRELLPGPDEGVAAGDGGTFAHEIVLSFTRREPRPRAPVRPAVASGRRRFPPGSSWAYLKVYAGAATCDEVLRRLAPSIRQICGDRGADRWFFLRYGDPHWHLRLRFGGDPAMLQSRALPALQAALRALVDEGLVWRVALDTYERELERYGGVESMALCEELFCADSDAVLGIVELLSGDAGSDVRWRLGLRGTDMLLEALGYDLDRRLAIITRARESFGREFDVDTAFQRQLGARYRAGREVLERLLAGDPAWDEASELAPGLDFLARRTARVRPIGDRLRVLARAGRLAAPLDDIAWSLAHMHLNRILRSQQRAQELVIYDYLRRHYASVRAGAAR